MPSLALPSEELADFCRRNGIRLLALFGSFLRGDADETSDVDLLFELMPGRRVGLLALFKMQSELSVLLGRPVDFAPRDGLKSGLREAVLSEAWPLFPSLHSKGKRMARRDTQSAARRDTLYLRDITEAANAIAVFLTGAAEAQFLDSDLLQSAVLQKLSVIGEAAARLSPERKAAANYDRTGKFGRYRRLAALREYVFVHQDTPHAEQFTRVGDIGEMAKYNRLNETLAWSSLGVTVPLHDLYENVAFWSNTP